MIRNEISRTAGPLLVGVVDRIQTIDPGAIKDTLSARVVGEVCETAFSLPPVDPMRPQAALIPQPNLLAEPLRSEPGPRATIFSAPLRQGVVFSDGTPLTPALFASTLMEKPVFKETATAESRDDRIVFRLREPNARFDLFLTQIFTAISIQRGRTTLGTGPMMFPPNTAIETLRRAETISLVPNERFRMAERVRVPEIRFVHFAPDRDGTPRSLFDAFIAGEAHYSESLLREQAEDERLKQVATPLVSPGMSVGSLVLNSTRIPVGVRRAIGAALNRPTVAEAAFGKRFASFRAKGPLPKAMGELNDGLEHNPREARRLIDEAGGPPRSFVLLVLTLPKSYLPKPVEMAVRISESLATIGIQVTVKEFGDTGSFFAGLDSGEYDAALTGWIGDSPDPAAFLSSNLHSKYRTGVSNSPNANNYALYVNPAMDKALDDYQADAAAGTEPIMRLFRSEVPYVPLVYGANVCAYRKSYQRMHLNVMGQAQLSFAVPI